MNDDRHLSKTLTREAEAARDLLAQLASDDDMLNHDMVEGETGLLEALTAAVAALDDAEAQIAGCKDREDVFKARRVAAERRRERIRALIEQAILRADMQGVRLPVATLTVQATKPAPIYDDEASIPAKFWKAGTPTLDKAAIKEALKSGETIPGVSLTNGGVTLHIRRQ